MLVLHVLMKVLALESRNAWNIFVRYTHLNLCGIPLSRPPEIDVITTTPAER